MDATFVIGFLDTNNRVNMLSEMLNVANVLREWNNFHSVAGFFACIRAYSAISWPKKTHALLLETTLKTLDKRDDSLGLEPKNYPPYQRDLDGLNDRCLPFMTAFGKGVTFMVYGAQGTFEADLNGKRCLLFYFARRQASTRQSKTPCGSRKTPSTSRLPTTQRGLAVEV